MKYECIKLIRQVHVKAAFLLAVIISVLLGISSVNSTQSLVDPESSTYVKGKAAFENERQKYAAVQGDITIEKLNKALQDIQSCANEWSAETKAIEAYPGIGQLLMDAYAAMDGHFTLFEIENADDFYDRMQAELKLAVEDRGLTFSEHEMKNLLEWARKAQTPYKNEMAAPWKRFYTNFQLVLMLNLLTVIIYASNLFSYEKNLRMDLVIGTLEPDTIHKIAVNKAKALACLAGIQYFVSMSATCAVYFANSGPIAWKSQIQTLFFTSILPLTYQQIFFVSILSGFFACLATAFLAAALNAKLQKSMPVWIAGIAITFAPLLLRNFSMLPNSVMKLIQALPVNAALLQNTINSFYLYPFPGNGIPGIYAILIVSALLMGILACCSVHIARTHMCMD